jgi:hypothetical protein
MGDSVHSEAVAGFRRGGLTVVSTGYITDPDDGATVAAMLLDTSTRPDVADLARVHAIDGVGDLRCGLGVYDVGPPEAWLVRVEVVVDHPVRCRFHAVVGWLEQRTWLAAVVHGASVAVGTQDPDGYWLRLNVNPALVAPVLDQLDRRAS